jgi:hypothetical protein
MAGNANLILAGVGGGGTGSSLAYFAPQGTAAPTDATTALAAAYRDAGWVTEDGLTRAVAEDSTDINAFGSGAPVRTLVTNSRVTFAMGFLESNPISLAIYHRLALTAITPVAATGAFDLTEGAHRTQKYAAVFEIVDGSNHLRAFCPSVEVTDRADLSVTAGSEISYGVTLTAYPGTDGVAVHWFYLLAALATG